MVKVKLSSLCSALLVTTGLLVTSTVTAPPAHALGTLTTMTITPATSNVTVGTPITYVANGKDALGLSLGLVTLTTTFSLGAGNGTCVLNVCTPTKAGNLTVTATNGSVVATASIVATAGPAASVSVTPTTSSIDATLYQDYIATAADAYGNSLGNVTSSTTFSIDSGTCTGARCSSTTAGTRTVTARFGLLLTTAQLTVTKSTLTITASDSASLTYGDPVPAITPTYTGFVNGGTVGTAVTTAPTCATTYTTHTASGTYPGGTSCSGAVVPAYNAQYVAGSYTVAKRVLTVTAPSLSTTYRSATTLTPSYAGFANGDGAGDLATAPTCTTNTSLVGAQPVTCSGGADPRYTFVYVAGVATVAKRPLVVTASAVSSVYGAVPGAVTASYSGFAAGESVADLTTAPTCSSTSTATSAVGSAYVTSCSGAVSNNYAFTYVPGVATVTKRVVTVTAPSPSRVFGSTGSVDLTPTSTGFLSGDTWTTSPVCTTNTDTFATAGTYAVTCTPGTTSGNYQAVYVPGTLTVTKAPLTVLAPVVDKLWGASVPTLTPTYVGLLDGPIATPPVCVTTATFLSLPGAYPVTCLGAADPNYVITNVPGTLTVTIVQDQVSVTGPSFTTTYGQPIGTLSPVVTGLPADVVLDSVGTCATTATSTSPVGTYPVVCVGASDPRYEITTGPGTVTITAAPLTVQAPSASTVYGEAVPTLTPSYVGLVNGETAPATTPDCTTVATSSSPAGDYAVTCSGASDPNYDVSYRAGTLTVTSAAVTVQAPSATYPYGTPVPSLLPSYVTLRNGQSQTQTPATCTTTATDRSPVGAYPVTCVGAADPNYTISYAAGTIRITKADLTVIGPNTSAVYGDAIPALTPVYDGLAAWDAAPATLATCTSGNAGTPPAGFFDVTCSGASDPNYTVRNAAGTLWVTKAPLRITAPSPTYTYGGTPPTLAPIYSGLKNGATAPATPATCTSAAVASSPAGSYPSTCSGAVDGNYFISYTKGAVTVAKAPLTLWASSGTRKYGAANPAFTYTAAGFVRNETVSVLNKTPKVTSPALATSHPGAYPVTITNAAAANYAITVFDGSLEVTPAPLTVTAPSPTFTYGGTVPALTPVYSGLMNGAKSPATKPVCATAATKLSPVGTYSSSCTGRSDIDYLITEVTGTTTVAKAPLKLTASSASRPFGAANPALTYKWTGFVNGDTDAVVTSELWVATTATPASHPGSYVTAVGGTADAANYTITRVNGALSVTKAPVTMTVTPVDISATRNAGFATFTAAVRIGTGAPAAGQPIKFAGKTATGLTFGCTTTTDASGVATCTSDAVDRVAAAKPMTFTVTATTTTDYAAGTATGVIRN